MNYQDAESLIQSFATNHWLINTIIDGLTNADSLVQPPYDGNCLNWVLGHIVSSRHTALKLAGGPPVWSQEEADRYKTGSQPIVTAEQALPLDKLISDLDLTQERISAALAGKSQDELMVEAETNRGLKPVTQHLAGLHWHETYHTGQLELLRDLAKANQGQ